ncbi:MAG: murein L,D-transpeptidase catalytic domain family protein [Bacteriovoracaceae bacterium]|nr:murein L,D-transpeptidase catalytic domain family protein [Bacteriovoracaceae bacterium]
MKIDFIMIRYFLAILIMLTTLAVKCDKENPPSYPSYDGVMGESSEPLGQFGGTYNYGYTSSDRTSNLGREIWGGADPSITLNNFMSGPVSYDYCPVPSMDSTGGDEDLLSVSADQGIQTIFRNYTRLGGNPMALKQALCFHNLHKHKSKFKVPNHHTKNSLRLKNDRYITINDLTKNSNQKRLFVIDTYTGKIEAYHSAHGKGKPPRSSSIGKAKFCSNRYGSNETPSGFMVIGPVLNRPGKKKGRGWNKYVQLNGVQKGINDRTRARGVVLHHGKNYISDTVSPPAALIKSGAVSARTLGCTAVSDQFWPRISKKIKGGSLYYNYSPREAVMGDSYCGDKVMTL